MKQETLITDRRSSCHCSGGVLSLLNATQVNGQLSASLVATVPVLTAQNAMPLCCRACHGMSLGSNGFKLLQQIAKGMDTDRLTPSASHDFLDYQKRHVLKLQNTIPLLAAYCLKVFILEFE